MKARALAVYRLVFKGAMTGGSVLWGSLATGTSVATALVVAAVGQAAALVLALRWRVPQDSATDLSPSNHWAEPVVSVQPGEDRGPVLIEIGREGAPAGRRGLQPPFSAGAPPSAAAGSYPWTSVNPLIQQVLDDLTPRLLAQFRADLTAAPDDLTMLALIDELRKVSPDFRRWFEQPAMDRYSRGIVAVLDPGGARKDFAHETLIVDEQRHQRMIFYFGLPL